MERAPIREATAHILVSQARGWTQCPRRLASEGQGHRAGSQTRGSFTVFQSGLEQQQAASRPQGRDTKLEPESSASEPFRSPAVGRPKCGCRGRFLP